MVGCKVLLIDDNDIHAYALEKMIRRHCEWVDVAHDGLEAFRMAVEMRYNLILIDRDLGGVDGLTIARTLRLGAHYAETPIILYSAYWELSAQDLLASGCNDFLRYPFREEEFETKMQFWIQISERAGME
jgi:CheY-like chemotaxis protein